MFDVNSFMFATTSGGEKIKDYIKFIPRERRLISCIVKVKNLSQFFTK